MKNADFMKKGILIEPGEVREIKNHLVEHGCTECGNHVQLLRWVPEIWYVNCPDCGIIYKFDFVSGRAERLDVSITWASLLKIASG